MAMTADTLAEDAMRTTRRNNVRVVLDEFAEVDDRPPPGMPLWVAAVIVICTNLALALVIPYAF